MLCGRFGHDAPLCTETKTVEGKLVSSNGKVKEGGADTGMKRKHDSLEVGKGKDAEHCVFPEAKMGGADKEVSIGSRLGEDGKGKKGGADTGMKRKHDSVENQKPDKLIQENQERLEQDPEYDVYLGTKRKNDPVENQKLDKLIQENRERLEQDPKYDVYKGMDRYEKYVYDDRVYYHEKRRMREIRAMQKEDPFHQKQEAEKEKKRREEQTKRVEERVKIFLSDPTCKGKHFPCYPEWWTGPRV